MSYFEKSTYSLVRAVTPLAFGATSVTTTATNGAATSISQYGSAPIVLKLCASTPCFVKFYNGATNQTASSADHYFEPNISQYITVSGAIPRIAALQVAAPGTLYISECS